MSRGGGYKALYEQEQFLNQLGRDLERISGQQDSARVIRFALRRIGESLGTDLLVQADVRRTDGSFDRPFTLPLTPRGKKLVRRTEEAGFLETFRTFLKRPLGPPDRTLLLLLVSVEGRPESVLGFLRAGREFSRAETHRGQDAARLLSENLRHRERERVQGLKERIYAKVLSEIRPQDVLYQILHGLKRLLQYDHGGTVLLLDPENEELAVRAEIVAWTKAKSGRIGQRMPLTPELRAWMEQARHPVLLHAGEETPAGGNGAAVPPCLTRPLRSESDGEAPARAMIVAVLRHKGDPLGILQLRARSAAAFHPADVRVLDEFLPLASVTLYNSSLYMTQHDLLLSAERKTALAVLARAISHDLANAFTVMLPLLQQMRQDAADGNLDPQRLPRDLEVLEHYAKSSSRIFQGLLSMARGTQEPPAWADLPLVLESVHRMLGPSLEAKGIEVRREVTGPLPRVFLRRGDFEQVLLNLVYNARDAMPGGGQLAMRCRPEDGGVAVEVADTGEGMTEEVRRRIFEPFFTTKGSGSGLGLDISRSIIWDYDGRIDIESEPGRGTTVRFWLPRFSERLRQAAGVSPDE
jgi:signal transduction histidine kinase